MSSIHTIVAKSSKGKVLQIWQFKSDRCSQWTVARMKRWARKQFPNATLETLGEI